MTDTVRMVSCGGRNAGKTTLIQRLFPDRPEIADRRFVVVDVGSDEEALTAAGDADMALLVVDASRGVTNQIWRHTATMHLLGVRSVVLAVNKMDLVGFDQARFEAIAAAFRIFAGRLGIPHVHCLPVSALDGDMVAVVGPRMSWYEGEDLYSLLARLTVTKRADQSFRLMVDAVADGTCAGLVVSGRVRPGDKVIVQPTLREARILRLALAGEETGMAVAGQRVSLTLTDAVIPQPGEVVAAADHPAEITDQFAAHLLWLSPEPMLPGRRYSLRLGSRDVGAEITDLKHKLNVETLEHQAGKTVKRFELAFCNLALEQAVAFDPANRVLGGFTLFDRFTGTIVAVGTIAFGLRRATNLSWHTLDVDKAARARAKGQTPCVVWLTGLSGSGKSTVANLVERKLHAIGRHTYVLDGDNVRHGLNKDLGFTDADRVENIRRIAEVAKLFVDAGLVVITSFISPFRSERRMARELLGENEFLEIFLEAPLAECERRDPKGLYAKARAGKIAHFTGIDSAYEPPEAPALVLHTADLSAHEAADHVIALLRQGGHV